MNPQHEASRPFSPACERNQAPILEVLREQFATRRHVLEVGSGTGQHAVHFARAMPSLVWQASDVAAHLPGIESWRRAADLPNLPPAIGYDVGDAPPSGCYDAVFTANTLHIMSWAQVQALFEALPALLEPEATVVVYGPFNIDGRFTSPSNEEFDAQLRAVDPLRGIRDLEAVTALATTAGLVREAVYRLPANNFCVCWRRTSGARD